MADGSTVLTQVEAALTTAGYTVGFGSAVDAVPMSAVTYHTGAGALQRGAVYVSLDSGVSDGVDGTGGSMLRGEVTVGVRYLPSTKVAAGMDLAAAAARDLVATLLGVAPSAGRLELLQYTIVDAEDRRTKAVEVSAEFTTYTDLV